MTQPAVASSIALMSMPASTIAALIATSAMRSKLSFWPGLTNGVMPTPAM